MRSFYKNTALLCGFLLGLSAFSFSSCTLTSTTIRTSKNPVVVNQQTYQKIVVLFKDASGGQNAAAEQVLQSRIQNSLLVVTPATSAGVPQNWAKQGFEAVLEVRLVDRFRDSTYHPPETETKVTKNPDGSTTTSAVAKGGYTTYSWVEKHELQLKDLATGQLVWTGHASTSLRDTSDNEEMDFWDSLGREIAFKLKKQKWIPSAKK